MKKNSRSKKKGIFIVAITFLLVQKLFAQIVPPYFVNFELPADTVGWTHYANFGTDDWEYGVPSGPSFSSTPSGVNAWLTNLTGDFAVSSSRYLETPYVDLSQNGVQDLAFSFKHKRQSNVAGATFKVEYSLNHGATWQILYNTSAAKKNWQTSTGFSLAFTGTQEATTSLSFLPAQDSVKFRFWVNTLPTSDGRGWMIDDVKIQEATYNLMATQGDTLFHVNPNFDEFTVESVFNFSNYYTTMFFLTNDFYLSTDDILDGGDLYLGQDAFSENFTITSWTNTFDMPAGLNAGTYYIIYRLDALNVLDEISESDNINYTVMIVDSIYGNGYATNFDDLTSDWTTAELGGGFDWKHGDPNNWHVEDARSHPNGWYSPPTGTTAQQYIESPYLDLSTADSTTLCFWYRNSGVFSGPTVSNLTIKYPTVGGSSVTYPAFSGTGSGSLQVKKPRLYTWDCYCASFPQYNGDISTKFRISGYGSIAPSNFNQTVIDDIYIGDAKPDAAIGGFMEDRFTSAAVLNDTLLYYFFNSGLTPMQSTTTEFYWSDDSLLDIGDVLLGSTMELALDDTDFVLTSFDYVKPTNIPGNYYLIYKVDAADELVEMREYDNIGYFQLTQYATTPLPYSNDFEANADGWSHRASLGSDEWVWGEPQGTFLDTAFSGVKAWVTNGSTPVAQNSRMHLFTPVFDLTTMDHPVLEFDLLQGGISVGSGTNILYSSDGGHSWNVIDVNNSFKRLYNPLNYSASGGTENFSTAGSGYQLGYGKNQKVFLFNNSNHGRDYDEITRYVLDLDLLNDAVQIQFMFVFSNAQTVIEGILLDNFVIREAISDFKVHESKSLLASSGDQKINFYFDIKNDDNYISEATGFNLYCSADTIIDASDSLFYSAAINAIMPYAKRQVVISAEAPSNYGTYNYVLYELDPDNLVVESDELNNTGYFPLDMDSCANYAYPVLFDFEQNVIDGWTWYHDSTEFSAHRFRHHVMLTENVNMAQNGEWFLDRQQGGNDYPTHFLETPAFDFSNYADIHVSFDFVCVGTTSGASTTMGGNFEYSVDGGLTWILLTQIQDPYAVNWYNVFDIETLNHERGWGYWEDWSTAQYNLSFLNGESSVRFRFKFNSSLHPGTTYRHGFRLDNFKIEAQNIDLKTTKNFDTVYASTAVPDFQVVYDIINLGQASVPISDTKIYWSPDSIFDASDSLLYTINEDWIPGLDTIDVTRGIYYPVPITQPVYYLFYVLDADDDVSESSNTNNIGSFKIIFDTVVFCDLKCVFPSSTISAVGAPGNFPINYQYVNAGTSPSNPAKMMFYWSDDNILSTDDMLLYEFTEPGLPDNTSVNRLGDIYFPIPVIQQEYYLLVKTDDDNATIESNELNNLEVITISFIDLGTGLNNSPYFRIWYHQSLITLQYLSLLEEQAEISVYNLMGEIVYNNSFQFNAGENKLSFEVKDLSRAMYVVYLKSATRSLTFKFVYNG